MSLEEIIKYCVEAIKTPQIQSYLKNSTQTQTEIGKRIMTRLLLQMKNFTPAEKFNFFNNLLKNPNILSDYHWLNFILDLKLKDEVYINFENLLNINTVMYLLFIYSLYIHVRNTPELNELVTEFAKEVWEIIKSFF